MEGQNKHKKLKCCIPTNLILNFSTSIVLFNVLLLLVFNINGTATATDDQIKIIDVVVDISHNWCHFLFFDYLLPYFKRF